MIWVELVFNSCGCHHWHRLYLLLQQNPGCCDIPVTAYPGCLEILTYKWVKQWWFTYTKTFSILTTIFPGGPVLTSTTMSPFWILLELHMMEVAVTTGAIRRAKLQSNCHHQQTNTQLFTGRMPFLLLNQQCQSTKGKGLLVVNKVRKSWNCWICIAACLPSTPATWLWDLSTWWWFVVSIWGRW